MTTDNWLAIGAGATFLLALAAFWAIWQNYRFRKEDRKYKSLDDIRNWAKEGLKLVARIYRLPTSHENFPPVWEVIAYLADLESQRYLLLECSEILHNNALKNTLNKAITEVSSCLGSYKRAEAMNIRLDNARKCEDAFIEVLNEASKLTKT